MRTRTTAATLILAIATALAGGQEKTEPKADAAAQKAAVAANLKKADLGGASVVETENFLVATTLPMERAAALAAVLEKAAAAARKGAQFEAKEQPWKGKLAVYYLPSGPEFKSFIRGVVMDQPGGTHFDLRGENPFVVDPAVVGPKATEADRFANAAAVVGGAYLKGKAGAAVLPDWLTDGFGRVTAARAEGLNSPRYRAHRAAASAAAFGARGGKPAALADLWAADRPASAAVLASSFAEYLAYGPGKDNFAAFIGGFRPNENGDTPGVPQALEAAGWKDVAALEAAWRKWVRTGK